MALTLRRDIGASDDVVDVAGSDTPHLGQLYAIESEQVRCQGTSSLYDAKGVAAYRTWIIKRGEAGSTAATHSATTAVTPVASTATAAAAAVADVAGTTPAGGTGATAGAYDTSAHRDALIATVAELKGQVNALLASLRAAGVLLP